ncbi:alpha/beta fold hydrolase [Nocardia sp. NBC_01388]|uniref:alpha/beta fold hydrolase n=1 Tax=Nocardia sp. NBC_01388 TaxID=2903596 RepID=UPI00324ABA3A
MFRRTEPSQIIESGYSRLRPQHPIEKVIDEFECRLRGAVSLEHALRETADGHQNAVGRSSLLFEFIVSGSRPTPERMRKFNRWLMPGFELSDEESAFALAAVKFRMAMPWDRPFTDEQLAAITAPSLIFFGADTVVSDPELGAARARNHIPSADVEIYPGIGHDLLWANPEQIIPRFLDFVSSYDQVRLRADQPVTLAAPR